MWFFNSSMELKTFDSQLGTAVISEYTGSTMTPFDTGLITKGWKFLMFIMPHLHQRRRHGAQNSAFFLPPRLRRLPALPHRLLEAAPPQLRCSA